MCPWPGASRGTFHDRAAALRADTRTRWERCVDWTPDSLLARPGILACLNEPDGLVHAVVADLATHVLHRPPQGPTAVLARGSVHVMLLSSTLQAKLHSNCHEKLLPVLFLDIATQFKIDAVRVVANPELFLVPGLAEAATGDAEGGIASDSSFDIVDRPCGFLPNIPVRDTAVDFSLKPVEDFTCFAGCQRPISSDVCLPDKLLKPDWN